MKFKICYSPTGTSRKAVQFASKKEGELFDWTLMQSRGKSPKFSEEDILYISFPVYSGRLPKLLLKHVNALEGNGAKAIIIAVYGNRHYDDSIIEMNDLLTVRGFTVIGAAAIVGEHSYTSEVATNYPIESDLQKLAAYSDKRIELNERLINIPGNRPYRPYNKSKAEDQPHIIKPPKTSDKCILCGKCVESCPVSAIDDDCHTIAYFCTMCCACIKVCPVDAKSLADEKALGGKAWLEANCTGEIRPLEVFN